MPKGFSAPGVREEPGNPAAGLPAEVVQEINASCARFEERFSPYRMFVGSQISGWVSDYRKELISLAVLCFNQPRATGSGGSQ